MKWWIVAVVGIQCFQYVVGAKILAICAIASHSHSLWCYQYMAALVERGHEITVLGVDKPKNNMANITTFIGSEVYEAILTSDAITDWLGVDSKLGSVIMFKAWTEAGSKSILHSQALKDLRDKYKNIEKPFDLIIHDDGSAEALLALVPIFGNPPLLLATTYGSPQWMTLRAGNILNPAYVPSMISNADQYMTFFERCENTFHYIYLEWFSYFIFDPFQDKLMKEVFGYNLPNGKPLPYVREIAKQANIIIVNYHPALNSPRPMLPGVVGIAGLHISEPKPLPQDIKVFMDGAKHGVILLSFGSNLNSNWLPKDLEKTILDALAPLPQRVLWKWDKEVANVSPNIKISKWLPQGDMLVHPNMCLFVTHCGLLSTQEAIYQKVPVLALPVFLDQMDNADMLVKKNLTIKLNIYNMTSDELRNGIKEILTNPMYKSNMKKTGELMRDTPMTPKQQAVFWTEYAIKHQGAEHLRSVAADMPWYQLLLLDVLSFVVLSFLIIVWIVKAILSFVIKRVTYSKSKIKSN